MGSIAAGTVLNQKYEIIECIGIGGMSEVYRTVDKESGVYVALKILKPEFSSEADFIKRFNNEAKAASLLEHANIVSIYGVGNDGDIHYIVMEYVEGITLKDYIEAYQTLPWQDALKITAQILLAMDHAHSKHIIHRDIKPQNVMIGNTGSVKLTDFGIARAATAATINSTDDAGSVHYLSPEQARGGYVDERSDLYSLGISLFEMLIGVVPYDGDSNISVALKHLDGKIVPPHEIDLDIPVGVSDLVVIATRKDPGMRFQSARDMISKIKKVMANPNESLFESDIDDPEAVVASVFSDIGEPKIKKDFDDVDDADGVLTADEVNDADLFETGVFDDDEEDIPSESKVARAGRIIGLVLTYTAAAVFAVFAVMWVLSCYTQSKSSLNDMFDQRPYIMMDFEGHKYEEVIKTLEEKGIVVTSELEYTDDVPAGVVIAQSVSAGIDISAGDEVNLLISCPKDSFELSADIINSSKTFEEVQQILTEKGALVESYKVMSANVKKGCIVRSEPEVGSYVKKGETVVLYVCSSLLNNQITVPNFIGLNTSEVIEKAVGSGMVTPNIYVSQGADVTGIIQMIKDAEEAFKNPSAAPSETPSVESTEEPLETPDVEFGDEENDLNQDSDTLIPDEGEEDDEDDYNYNDAVEPQYASNTVVSQFPPAGTIIYEWEAVDIYFYNREALSYLEDIKTDSDGIVSAEIREVKSVELNYPADLSKSGIISYIRIKYTLKSGEVNSDLLTNCEYSDFPKLLNVPFAYGTNVTRVDIYMPDKDNREIHYKRIYVYD